MEYNIKITIDMVDEIVLVQCPEIHLVHTSELHKNTLLSVLQVPTKIINQQVKDRLIADELAQKEALEGQNETRTPRN